MRSVGATFSSVAKISRILTLDPSTLNVEVATANGSYVVPRDASKRDGWDYLPGGKQLQVYGEACKKLADDGAKVKVVVGCTTVIK